MSGPEGSMDQATPEPAVPAPAIASPAAPMPMASPVNSVLASMSRAEMFVAGGALVVLATDLVFDILADSYAFVDVIWAAALAALLVVFLGSRTSVTGATARLLTLGAVGVTLYGTARNLLLDILFIPGRSLSATYFLGALALYAGVALMAYGAWMLWRSRSA